MIAGKTQNITFPLGLARENHSKTQHLVQRGRELGYFDDVLISCLLRFGVSWDDP